jgi:H+/Cl- antiporter ClcA
MKGNNLLFEVYHDPTKDIPFRMAPLVLLGTLVTHLFGGSAGREGTAVQMGGALADRCTRLFKLKSRDKKKMLIMGVSGGFASVFGTPLAGTVFALEVLIMGRMRYEALLPSLLTAVLADYTCTAWQVHHTHYSIEFVPIITPENLIWAITAGVCFGLMARLFSTITHFWSRTFSQLIAYAPMRPVVGGIVLAAIIWFSGNTRYIGLGIPVIEETFVQEVGHFDFLLKTLFTSFTLGAGFKGGEVTPLFYIGATLGNTLSQWIMLPMALLAGMGFVAVFSGATNTPIACTLMGMELFGTSCGVYVGIACVVAYLLSGHSGIYGAQLIGSPKHMEQIRQKGKTIAGVQASKR